MDEDEKEYIERNAVIEEIESLSVTVTGLRAGNNLLRRYAKHYKESVVRLLTYAPAADVVEVVHAHWIDHKNGNATCSHCRIRQKAVYDDDNEQHYCGHCGAKMDGERKEA